MRDVSPSETRTLRELIGDAVRAARQRPSFGLYLLALAAFPFKWLSPFVHEQAGWIDAFIAAAVLAWLVEGVRRRAAVRLRAPHYIYAAYVAAVAISAAFVAADRPAGAEDLLIVTELVALAVVTADYARDRAGLSAIAVVVLLVTFVTLAEDAVGLTLYYLGESSSLALDSYSGYFESSRFHMTRINGGFYSAPLLGSFCIFASAVLAMEGTGLSRRARWAGQAALGALVVLTLSLPLIGFSVAAAIRLGNARGTRRARRLATAFCIAAIGTAVALSLVPFTLNPLRPPNSDDTNPRLTTMKTSAETLRDHPLGKGGGSRTARLRGDRRRAHLTPLNVAATTGPPALAALTALVVVLWRRRRPTNVALWSGMAGLGVDALGQDVEHFRHVWIMLGMADADRADADERPN